MKLRIPSRKVLLPVFGVILGVVLLAVAVFALADPYGCRMAEGVTIGGLDVSGMLPWEASRALKEAQASRAGESLTIDLPEDTITLTPQELKLRLSPARLVLAAFQAGRKTQDTAIPATLGLRYDDGHLRARLEAYAARYDTALMPSSHYWEGNLPNLSTAAFDPEASCQKLVLNPGVPERHLDVEAALESVDGLFRQIFSGQSLQLTLDVPPQTLPAVPDLDAIYRKFTREAVSDSLDMDSYQFVPGTYGYQFDLDSAKAALAAAPWGEPLSIPMEAVRPELVGQEVYFRDELGHCETKHTNDENRNTNLRLVCQTLDGLIIQPGEEFSYNGSVGERTAERGYKPAGAYSGNRLVKDIGGGVCQGSTTLYNCVLLADMEVLERHGHGFTVNYVPIGLDAAVNWATKTDFCFRNNWNFPIQIRAEVSNGYMRMQILGTDEKDYYIEMSSTRSDEELRIYSVSYKHKYDKETGEQISKEREAFSSYMYFTG